MLYILKTEINEQGKYIFVKDRNSKEVFYYTAIFSNGRPETNMCGGVNWLVVKEDWVKEHIDFIVNAKLSTKLQLYHVKNKNMSW